jgi:hypothetical protein
LKDNPNDDEFDALDAWKNEVKFINQFNDWDNQLDWENDWRGHLTNWHKDTPKSHRMPYNTFVHTRTDD